MKMGKITKSKIWEPVEVNQVIALYMTFLSAQFSGQKIVKSHHYKPLAEKLGRSIGSVESKLMNVSGALKAHGRLDLIVKGYKPLDNYSVDLLSAVEHEIIGVFDAVVNNRLAVA